MAAGGTDRAAIEALGRAMHRSWPGRRMDQLARGLAELFLVALRQDEAGRTAVATALLDEERLATAIASASAGTRSPEEARDLAREVLAALRAERS